MALAINQKGEKGFWVMKLYFAGSGYVVEKDISENEKIFKNCGVLFSYYDITHGKSRMKRFLKALGLKEGEENGNE